MNDILQALKMARDAFTGLSDELPHVYAVRAAILKAEHPQAPGKRQFWLAKLDQYGNPTLTDGPHDECSGAEQALYLIKRLGLSKDGSYACAEVFITSVEPTAHGADEDALKTLNGIGLTP